MLAALERCLANVDKDCKEAIGAECITFRDGEANARARCSERPTAPIAIPSGYHDRVGG